MSQTRNFDELVYERRGNMWLYMCDGMPTMRGCGNEILISRKYKKIGVKPSGWYVCYALDDNGPDKDFLLVFCPECTKVVLEQEKKSA